MSFSVSEIVLKMKSYDGNVPICMPINFCTEWMNKAQLLRVYICTDIFWVTYQNTHEIIQIFVQLFDSWMCRARWSLEDHVFSQTETSMYFWMILIICTYLHRYFSGKFVFTVSDVPHHWSVCIILLDMCIPSWST